MRLLFKALKSIRLALSLIAYLVVSGIIASIDKDSSAFYSSPYFLAPAFLFFANLATCSADRFVRERKRKGLRRHGPDILHLGLILLLLGSVFGQWAKQSHPSWQGFARLAKGQAVELPDGRVLRLMDLRSEKYSDGRPKDWVSIVELSKSGKILIPSFQIRVNHPLRLGPESIFQVSYFLEGSAIDGIMQAEQTGLQAVYDPFYPVIIVAFAVIALGACITFARKIGENTE